MDKDPDPRRRMWLRDPQTVLHRQEVQRLCQVALVRVVALSGPGSSSDDRLVALGQFRAYADELSDLFGISATPSIELVER